MGAIDQVGLIPSCLFSVPGGDVERESDKLKTQLKPRKELPHSSFGVSASFGLLRFPIYPSLSLFRASTAANSCTVVSVVMSAVPSFTCRHSEIRPAFRSDNRLALTSSINHRQLKFRPSREAAFNRSRTAICLKIRMTAVDERLVDRSTIVKPAEILAYDLVQGADVRWSFILDKTAPQPPTAILLHGILGSRKNWGTFARRLAKEFPKWQFLLVDLRCHGDSASLKNRGPHNVASAALDVLKLLGALKLTPRVVVGHSFGGKVALSMVDQVPKPLARPVRVWVLDSTPGKVRAGADGDDHPAELISFLSTLPKEVSSKQDVVDALLDHRFSKDVAQWVVTNLRQMRINGASSPSFSWAFDLNGISEMYKSYEETNLWKLVEDVPRGVHINFLKAERSLHRWALEDLRRIHIAEEQAAEEGGGVEMHLLEDAGHWVHADNPDGLFRILSFSFQGF